MGLNSFGDSDTAVDMYVDAVSSMIKGVEKSFRGNRYENSYNTDGAENVALIIRSGLFKNVEWDNIPEQHTARLNKILSDALKDMEKLIKGASDKKSEDWDEDGNRRSHLSAYKKMKKELEGLRSKLGEAE